MKAIRDLFFLLLGLLFSGAFAKGSEDATHGLPFHPTFHLQISKFDKNVQHDKATVHPKIDKVSSPHRMLFPETEPEFLDTTMSQRDVVTPVTTVPTINPTSPTTTTPTYNPLPTPANPTPTTNPYMTPTNPDTTPTNPYTTPTTNPDTTPTNPTTNPYTTPTMGNPTSPTPTMGNPTSPTPTMGNPTSPTPTMGNPTSSSGQSWCVASPSASQTALQVALDYACGYGGADCSAVQQGGSCFNPDTVRDHASYAFNNYYQKNPVPTSCDFSGTAIITNTDPSTSTCKYPSSSTSSSTLNTTSPTGGGSPVYGSSPFGSSPPDYTDTNSSSINTSSFTLICFLISLIYLKVYK